MERAKTPKAVVFDFGGVLCFHPPDAKFDPIAKIFGLPVSELIPLFWEKRAEYDAARLDAWTYWSDIARASGKELNDSMLRELIRHEVALWNNYDDRVLGWAAHLRASGFRTGILSNLPPALGAELRATPGFLDTFDHVTFSYELKSVKPEPAIYENAIGGLAVAPGEALFLDDRPENVEGARAVGMMAELFKSWEDFLSSAVRRYDLPLGALATDGIQGAVPQAAPGQGPL
ncbi:MAG: HAD family phosphatase [Bryobacterales bacterium]|nr:HAD family phosphatase [Bryobacterales bacterium]MBV9398546.1 HAD family phosphatase [Bryobacterales bacterium]